MAPSRWQGRRCSWRRAEASTVNKYRFIPLSSCHLCQNISGFWHLILWCLKAIFPRHWYKVTLNYLYHGSWPADLIRHPTLLPWPSFLTSLSSIFAQYSRTGTWNLLMSVINYTTWASEADRAGTFVWVFLLSCLMQILRYFRCLGRHKKQWHSLAWFHPPFKFTYGTLVETKLPLFLFWYTWMRMVVPHILLLMESRRRLKGVNI